MCHLMREKFNGPIHGINNLTENDSPSIPSTIPFQQLLDRRWLLAVRIVVLVQGLKYFMYYIKEGLFDVTSTVLTTLNQA